MELGKILGRMEDGDEHTLRSRLPAGAIDGLHIAENGEFVVDDLRKLFRAYYPEGPATSFLEPPMTDFVRQLDEHDQKSE